MSRSNNAESVSWCIAWLYFAISFGTRSRRRFLRVYQVLCCTGYRWIHHALPIINIQLANWLIKTTQDSIVVYCTVRQTPVSNINFVAPASRILRDLEYSFYERDTHVNINYSQIVLETYEYWRFIFYSFLIMLFSNTQNSLINHSRVILQRQSKECQKIYFDAIYCCMFDLCYLCGPLFY